jgi:hypothetical protein
MWRRVYWLTAPRGRAATDPRTQRHFQFMDLSRSKSPGDDSSRDTSTNGVLIQDLVGRDLFALQILKHWGFLPLAGLELYIQVYHYHFAVLLLPFFSSLSSISMCKSLFVNIKRMPASLVYQALFSHGSLLTY